MKHSTVRLLCLLTGGVLLFSAAGCGKKDESSGTIRDVAESAAETTEIVRQAELHAGTVGEEVAYKQVKATMLHAYLSPYPYHDREQDTALLFFQFSIQNNCEESIAVNVLSHTFGVEVDGESYAGITIRGPRFIYMQFGDGADSFDTNIEPGETREGYVCVEVPADFQRIRLLYFPMGDQMDWDEAFIYPFERDELETAPEPLESWES